MKLQTIGTLASAFAGLALAASVQAVNETGPALKEGHEYLIAVNYPGNLNVVDMGADTLYKQCKLPGSFGPGVFQISPDGKIAYVLTDHYTAIYGTRAFGPENPFLTNASRGSRSPWVLPQQGNQVAELPPSLNRSSRATRPKSLRS